MARSEALYLQDIVESVSIVARFVADKTFEDLVNDLMFQDALVRRLEIMGEAAAHLSRPLKERHPSIAWSDIVGFRNYAIHAYFSIDLSIIWSTAIDDVPDLGPAIEQVLIEEFPDFSGGRS